MAITTYDAVDDIISLIKTKWSNLRPPTISKVWDKRTVGFIDDRSDQVILSPKGEDINYFGLGGSAFWHDQMIEMEIRTYQDIDRHNSVVKEIVKIIKDNITGTTYTDLRVIGSFSKNYQYRNMFSYVVTISYRKSDPS
jgi:hypothetical protein|tara:strand:- start:8237 stop:8653 length:417 start_codon:yes stop_codon:yes gene_type:complete